MSLFKKVIATIASVLIFSIVGAGQAQAAETTLSGDDDSGAIAGAPSILFDGVTYTNGQIYYSTNNVLTFGSTFAGNRNAYSNYPGGPSISFNSLDWVIDFDNSNINGGVQRAHADEFLIINTTANTISINFSGRLFNNLSRASSVTTIQTVITVDQNNIPSYSYITGGAAVTGGRSLCQLHNLSITNCAPVTQDLNAIVLPRSNALRLDSAGTTTEKNNVVSCTPGKYTFLNGGSTAETANVQSYVYTLLVNGKAVSTLSSDGFKTVASHQFATIAGNMAGTATLDGASWNLAGMSNYSAQCQVYATQSGGNTQSITTAASDSVALAVAAEAAAKAQMSKDMIANWAATHEESVKKSRDNRLAGKP
jgi:hypothetical protein